MKYGWIELGSSGTCQQITCNLRKKTSRTSRPVWDDQCLKVPGSTTFTKRFSKLGFLKAVLFTMIANSEETKIKTSPRLNKFCIFSLPSPFCWWFFKELGPLLRNFPNLPNFQFLGSQNFWVVYMYFVNTVQHLCLA